MDSTRAAGRCAASIYREKTSNEQVAQHEFLRIIDGLQPGEVVVVKKIARDSLLLRLKTECLIASICAKSVAESSRVLLTALSDRNQNAICKMQYDFI